MRVIQRLPREFICGEQFDILLEQSMITVDLLLGRPKVDLETGKPKKGGDAVSFKIKKSAAGLLFPDSTIYTF